MLTPQQQYISSWHDSFVKYIGGLLGLVEGLMMHPEATADDKHALSQIKVMLKGQEACEIEQTLASGVVKQDTLDKIEKLEKDLVDMAVEHLSTDAIVKEFLKRLSYSQIEQNKNVAIRSMQEQRMIQ